VRKLIRKGWFLLLLTVGVIFGGWYYLRRYTPRKAAEDRYAKGTATTADFELLGPAYWAEALLSELEARQECDTRAQDGPAASTAMMMQAFVAAKNFSGGAYNTKLQYLRAILAKTGRPKKWGIVVGA